MRLSSGIYLTPDRRKRMKALITMYRNLEPLRNRAIFVSVYMIHFYVIKLCLASKNLP